MKHLTLILIAFILQSCAGMIDQMHRDFDRSDGMAQTTPPVQGNFDLYRGNPQFQTNRRPPTTAMSAAPTQLTSAQQQQVMPAVQRQYESQVNQRRRVRADDLRDNGKSGSLWVSDDAKSTQLFTNNRDILNGDIVLINVYNRLKNEITLELKRAFPEPLAAKKDDKKTDGSAPAATSTDQVNNAQAAPKRAGGDDSFDEGVTGTNRVYDRISSVVIEQIDDQHVLLRGRKDVLYKNRKRLIELQALIPKRDINDNNTVNSDSILEQTITVLR